MESSIERESIVANAYRAKIDSLVSQQTKIVQQEPNIREIPAANAQTAADKTDKNARVSDDDDEEDKDWSIIENNDDNEERQ